MLNASSIKEMILNTTVDTEGIDHIKQSYCNMLENCGKHNYTTALCIYRNFLDHYVKDKKGAARIHNMILIHAQSSNNNKSKKNTGT